jgi:hypothetical protein
MPSTRKPKWVASRKACHVDDAAVGAQAELAHDLQQQRRVARGQALVETGGERRLGARVGVVEELTVPGHGPSLPHRTGRAREAQ